MKLEDLDRVNGLVACNADLKNLKDHLSGENASTCVGSASTFNGSRSARFDVSVFERVVLMQIVKNNGALTDLGVTELTDEEETS